MNMVALRTGSALAIGALALGGAGSASAATTTKSKAHASKNHNARRHSTNSRSGHLGVNGVQEQPLADDVAQKVADAALAKVSGTLLRTETDADHGSPYEAHIRAADGAEYEVLVSESFEVTAVNAMGRDSHCGPGGSQSGSYPTD